MPLRKPFLVAALYVAAAGLRATAGGCGRLAAWCERVAGDVAGNRLEQFLAPYTWASDPSLQSPKVGAGGVDERRAASPCLP